MIDASDFERDCMNKALRPLGEYVAEIATDKVFRDLTREQVLMLIEVVVTAYGYAAAAGFPQSQNIKMHFVSFEISQTLAE